MLALNDKKPYKYGARFAVSLLYFAVLFPFYEISQFLTPETFDKSAIKESLTPGFIITIVLSLVILFVYIFTPRDIKGKNKSISHNAWIIAFGKQPILMPFLTLVTLCIGIWASVNSARLLNWIEGTPKELFSKHEIVSAVNSAPGVSIESLFEDGSTQKTTAPPGTQWAWFLLLSSFYGFFIHYRAVNATENKKDKLDQERNEALTALIALAPASNFHELLGNYVDIIEDFTFEKFSLFTKQAGQIRNDISDLEKKFRVSAEPISKQLDEIYKNEEEPEKDNKKTKQLPEDEKALKKQLLEELSALRKQTEENISPLIDNAKDLINEQGKYIRAALFAIGRLAAAFEQATVSLNSSQIYRANLMLKLTPDEVEGDPNTKQLFFPAIDVTPSYILGFNNVYSVLINDDGSNLLDQEGRVRDFKPDTDQTNFMMPVFLDKDENQLKEPSESQNPDDINDTAENVVAKQEQQRQPKSNMDETVTEARLNVMNQYNMFGAPTCIQTGEFDFVEDTLEEIKEWRAKGGLREIADEAERYYKSNKRVRSLLSIPLSTSRYNKDDVHPTKMVAALNIISNEPGMLSNTKKTSQFFHITRPIIISLSRMIHTHVRLFEIQAPELEIENEK